MSNTRGRRRGLALAGPRARLLARTWVHVAHPATMRRREEDYVDGAEFDDSDEPIEELSDDSDEYEALPSLPSAPLRSVLAEQSATKRKGSPERPSRAKAARTDKRPLDSGGYSWEAAYQRSWDHVHEDESGNLESAVRRMLASNKRKRALRDATPVQRGIIRHFVLVLDLSAEMAERDLRPNRYVPRSHQLRAHAPIRAPVCRRLLRPEPDWTARDRVHTRRPR